MMILNRIKLAVDRTIAAFSVAVMIALVVCVVWQVFSRYVLNQPSTLTDELARFLMIWVGLLGAAYTVGAQRHLAIDLLAMTLPPRRQALLSVIINLLIFIFAGSVIVTGGVKLIEKNAVDLPGLSGNADPHGLRLSDPAVNRPHYDVLRSMFCQQRAKKHEER